MLDHQSSAYIFAEDFDGENRANTSGTVYVERTMGSLFKAKVCINAILMHCELVMVV